MNGSCSPERKVVLLVDNCSAHGKRDNLLELQSVRVKYLPPRTISRLYTLDAGIIAAMKVRYRKFQLERALDMTDQKVSDIYKLDQLEAMQAFKQIWNGITPETMASRVCGITARTTKTP